MSTPKPRISGLHVTLGSTEIDVLDEITQREGLDFAGRFQESTGISKSHILGLGETALDMAERVARAALVCKEVKALLVVTQSYEPRSPGLGFALHKRLGLPADVQVFELNSACQGFVSALRLIAGSGIATLLVTCDTLGSQARSMPVDKSVRYLFADAASACVVTSFDHGIWISQGLSSFNSALELSKDFMHMDGEAVQFLACRHVPEVLKKIGSPVKPNFLHQANRGIIKRIASKTGLFIPDSFDKTANTTSSSIPCVMAHYFQNRGFAGDSYPICGFGAGFSVEATEAYFVDKPRFV